MIPNYCTHGLQNPLSPDVLELLFAELTPTGIWADYNPTLYFWYSLYWMATKDKMFDIACLPPAPNPADFPDTESTATRPLSLGLCARYGIPYPDPRDLP